MSLLIYFSPKASQLFAILILLSYYSILLQALITEVTIIYGKTLPLLFLYQSINEEPKPETDFKT